ncbi:MAG TPA: peptidase [Bacteroidales bacterium]|jgi:hypothetical protein|nr:peptidase [Bacteroidales bacterium]
MKKQNKSFRKVLRILHRDLGYIFIGLTIIYGISGIILNLKDTEKDPAYKEIRFEGQLEINLTPEEIHAIWEHEFENVVDLNRVVPVNNQYRLFLIGGLGSYHPGTGNISFVVYKKRPVVKFMNDIHLNSGKRFTWLGNIYGVIFIFFALSGAIMLKGKKGFAKRGWWLISIGILIPVVWYILSL